MLVILCAKYEYEYEIFIALYFTEKHQDAREYRNKDIWIQTH